jgi:hypothetical protein
MLKNESLSVTEDLVDSKVSSMEMWSLIAINFLQLSYLG